MNENEKGRIASSAGSEWHSHALSVRSQHDPAFSNSAKCRGFVVHVLTYDGRNPSRTPSFLRKHSGEKDLWVVEGYFKMGPMRIKRSMTIVRRKGELALFHTVSTSV